MADPDQLRHATLYGDLLVPLGELWRALGAMPSVLASGHLYPPSAAGRPHLERPVVNEGDRS